MDLYEWRPPRRHGGLAGSGSVTTLAVSRASSLHNRSLDSAPGWLKAHNKEKQPTSHPNLQLLHAIIRLWRGFSHRQWLCCSTFALFTTQTRYLQLPMAVTPDVKRFSRAMKRLFPPFSANFHPSVQNQSTLQLIYQDPLRSRAAQVRWPPSS